MSKLSEAQHEIEKFMSQIIIEEFKDYRDMIQKENEIYQEIDKLIPGNKYNQLEEFLGKEFGDKWYKHRKSLIKAEEKERLMTLEYNGKKYKAIYGFNVMYSGWDCDDFAWIIEDNGIKKLIMTNHGTPYEAEMSELEGLMKTYQEAIDNTKVALELLVQKK